MFKNHSLTLKLQKLLIKKISKNFFKIYKFYKLIALHKLTQLHACFVYINKENLNQVGEEKSKHLLCCSKLSSKIRKALFKLEKPQLNTPQLREVTYIIHSLQLLWLGLSEQKTYLSSQQKG